jgi:hypothetical protein
MERHINIKDQKVKSRALDSSAEALVGVNGMYEQYQEYIRKWEEPYTEWKTE